MKLNEVVISTEVEKELLRRASLALPKAHKAYDEFEKYSACVYTESGGYYEGFTIFSSTHSLTVHAEQAAIINAVLHHDEKIIAIALVSTDKQTNAVPCGICRQLLYENARFTKFDIKIFCKSSKNINRYNLSDLYPNQWPNREPKKRT